MFSKIDFKIRRNKLKKYCGDVENVVVPDGIEIICDKAFSNCTELKNITIPNSVTKIGKDAFFECNSLQNVYISDLSKWCVVDFAGYYSNPLGIACNLYLLETPLDKLIIPEGVTYIGNFAFMGESKISSVTIPNSVTSIGDFSFNNCNNLSSVIIPKSVKSIGEHAFGNCLKLKKIKYKGNAEQWKMISKGLNWNSYYDVCFGTYIELETNVELNYVEK